MRCVSCGVCIICRLTHYSYAMWQCREFEICRQCSQGTVFIYFYLKSICPALALSLSLSAVTQLFVLHFLVEHSQLLRSSLCAPRCHIVFRAVQARVSVCVTVAFKGSQRERTHSTRPTTADTIHSRSEQQHLFLSSIR